MSYADQRFIAVCRDILANGVWDTDLAVRPRWTGGAPAHTVKTFGVVNRYDLRKEFPIMTLRRTAFGKAYGYQLGVKHRYRDGWFDQVDRVLKDLREDPANRRMVTSLFNHHDLSEMGLAPCAWSMTFNVSGNTLNAILNQRSQDMLTASNWNVCQYAVLVHMMARASGLEAGELVHVIADCHIYDRHVPLVEALIAREPRPAPKLIIDPEVTDFYAFTPDSFRLEGYDPWPFEERIEVAV